MLINLHIDNYAIVESLNLELHNGLTIVTGETGAGKSVLIDSVGLALGDRADSSMIRSNCQRAEITADFDIRENDPAKKWLSSHELDLDNDCQLRRTISNDGRSRGYINGSPVPVQQLKELGNLLLDIHGQHAHQSLLKTGYQREILDEYANNKQLLESVSEQYKKWKSLNEEIEQLSASVKSGDDQIEFLKFQIRELEILDIGSLDIADLEKEQNRLANADTLIATCQTALNSLDNTDQSATNRINTTIRELSHLAKKDNQLQVIINLLENASIQINEAVSEIQHYLDTTELDPEKLNQVEKLLGTIHDAARKHHVHANELPGVLEQLNETLASLENIDARLAQLKDEIDTAATKYLDCAKKLSASRIKAAGKLDKLVSDKMNILGISGGSFKVCIEPNPDAKFSLHGLDTVRFTVTTNPGQPLKLLDKVASGGELSRISLAIQSILSQNVGIPTLIFDEVDSGIGGRVAEIVGQMLRTLSNKRQVVCITHLPQVASLGQQHLHVVKNISSTDSTAKILQLDNEQRYDEIARMLGGIEITEKTLAHAKDMIERAQQQLQ
ncbi:MAG: DNA repair protein RecN [Gammaproteobacteria bacterium]